LEIMGDRNVTWVPVVEALDDPRFLGWITALRAAVFLGVFDRRPSEAYCRELIEEPPALLTPDLDLDQARAIIAHWRLRRLPVVENGKLVGELGIE
ncbi:MAG: CBS domain-containing protein, partial [Terriglobales bacterium]